MGCHIPVKNYFVLSSVMTVMPHALGQRTRDTALNGILLGLVPDILLGFV